MQSIKAEPRHFVPSNGGTKTGVAVQLKTRTFNAISCNDPKHVGRERKRKITIIAALRTRFADMGCRFVGAQESRLPRGTFIADQFHVISSGRDSYNLG